MIRKPALFFVLASAVVLIVCLVIFKSQKTFSSIRSDISAPADSVSQSKSPELSTPIANDRVRWAANVRTQKAEPVAVPATPLTPQQLVAEILQISSAEGPITPEKAEKFRRNLEELIRQGATSVPAIRELLD